MSELAYQTTFGPFSPSDDCVEVDNDFPIGKTPSLSYIPCNDPELYAAHLNRVYWADLTFWNQEKGNNA